MRFIMMTALLFSLSTSLFAEEHALGKLTGPEIDLYSYDHGFAGKVRHFIVWGFLDESTFTSTLIMRKDEQLIQAQFKKNADGRIGGVVEQQIAEGTKSISIYMNRVDFKNKRIELLLNGELKVVTIEGEFSDGHFHNPIYSVEVDGETLEFNLEGDACFGLSFHYVSMLLAAYLI